MIQEINRIWNQISTIGTSQLNNSMERSKIVMVNRLIALAILVDVFVIFALFFFAEIKLYDLLIIAAGSPIKFGYFFLVHKQYHQLAHLIFFLFIILTAFSLTLFYGPVVGLENLYILAILSLSILFNDRNRVFIGTLCVILSFVAGRYIFYNYGVLMPADEYALALQELETRGIMTFVILIVIVVFIVNWYIKEVTKLNQKSQLYLEEINHKNTTLTKINDEMERFAYIASHDLKTPLRTVVSFLGIIEKKLKKQEYENLEEYINYAQNGATQMHHLITDILEYSRLSSSESEKSLVDLNDVFDSVKQQINPLSNQYQIVRQSKLPTLIANKTKMKTLFQNLIENGLKYNDKKEPTISIKSTVTSDKVVLEFIDNGIGVDPKYKSKIFEMFKRLHTSSDYQGTGIGLAICKKIVDSMNGIIDVKKGQTEGSVFTVSIPK